MQDTSHSVADNTATTRLIYKPLLQDPKKLSDSELEQLVLGVLKNNKQTTQSSQHCPTRQSISSELSFAQEGMCSSSQDALTYQLQMQMTSFGNQQQQPQQQQSTVKFPSAIALQSETKDIPNNISQFSQIQQQLSPQFQSPSPTSLFLSSSTQKQREQENTARSYTDKQTFNANNNFNNGSQDRLTEVQYLLQQVENTSSNNQPSLSKINKTGETYNQQQLFKQPQSLPSSTPNQSSNNHLNLFSNSSLLKQNLSDLSMQITKNASSTSALQSGNKLGLSPSRLQSSSVLTNSTNKVRNASPGWSDSSSPAIAGALKILKDKHSTAEQRIRELEQICEKQRIELQENNQNGQELSKANQQLLKLTNENAILNKQLEEFKNKKNELTTEVMYLKKCSEILENEKSKHLEQNAMERDQLDNRISVISNLRSADKQLIDKLESDLRIIQNQRLEMQERLLQQELKFNDLKSQSTMRQTSLENRAKRAEQQLNISNNQLNNIQITLEKERNNLAKKSQSLTLKEQQHQQTHSENQQMKKDMAKMQQLIDLHQKQSDNSDKSKKKIEKERDLLEESCKQLKGIAEEVISTSSRDGGYKIKESMHLFSQRLKKIEEKYKVGDSVIGNSSISTNSRVNSAAKSSRQLNSQRESKSKDKLQKSSSKSHIQSTSSAQRLGTSRDRKKKDKSNGPSKKSTVIITSTGRRDSATKRSKSRGSQDKSRQALELEDLNESLLSKRSAKKKILKTSTEDNSLLFENKLHSRDNSLLIGSANNSVDYSCDSPRQSTQMIQDTKRKRSTSKQEERKQIKKHNLSNQSDIENSSSAINVQKIVSQGITSCTQPYQFPIGFDKMSESEISNEIFKLERVMADTKREYNNLLQKQHNNGEIINYEEIKQRITELAAEMQKHSDWQFVLKKRQREIITASFAKPQTLQQY